MRLQIPKPFALHCDSVSADADGIKYNINKDNTNKNNTPLFILYNGE